MIESGTISRLCFVFSNLSSCFEDYLMQLERRFHSDETKQQDNPTNKLFQNTEIIGFKYENVKILRKPLKW